MLGTFPGGSEIKASAWNAGDPGSIPGLGRPPGEGNGNPLQYSCLENPMEGGAYLYYKYLRSISGSGDFEQVTYLELVKLQSSRT